MSELGDESLMTDCLLGDALGSARQFTDAQGQITLAKAYNPGACLECNEGAK